ncbi:MAG: sortase [bacterium]
MKFIETWHRRKEKKYKILYKSGPSTLAWIFAGMAFAFWGIVALLSSYPAGLYLYYSINPATTKALAQALSQTGQRISESANQQVSLGTEAQVTIKRDPSLPDGHFLKIPQIGVQTTILEAPQTDYEQVLRKGVWRVPDFGMPDRSLGYARDKPMILAAHRFGYLEWTQQFRRENSFYNLPKLKVGDRIEVVWDQHRYEYQIEKVSEGTKIDNYSSDLILYTCKFLVSPERIFVYARLIL